MSKRSKVRHRAYQRKQALAAVRAEKSAPPAPPVLTVVTAEPDVEASAEWILDNMPDGANEALRSVLEPLASLPVSSLIEALKGLDFAPIPIIAGAFTKPMRKAA